MRRPRLRSVVLRSREHGALYAYVKLSVSALALLLFGTNGTQDAVANGDTRTIDLVHTHTKETASITFKRNALTMPRRSNSSTGFCVTGAPTS